MEANIVKEGCMVGWKQIIVKKAAWLDRFKYGKEGCMAGCKPVNNAAWLDG
jgi:hypothetical protein